ncbi:MAG: hypothetical protein AMJ81_01365 [Phycisphaerae bacterium SM23_33]|nr:MAG: hypothetical protein AMJ81_01365 [Phycisphaerae bacterium SM23_33]
MGKKVTAGTRLGAASAQLLENLLQISLRLSATHDRGEMLEMIVREARRLSDAQAGSLYIRRGDELEFVVVQNDVVDVSVVCGTLLGEKMAVGSGSLAGFVAATGEVISIPDAARPEPGAPFRINREFDAATGYQTRSLLAIPLKCPDGEVVGVLQLINRIGRDGQVAPFLQDDSRPLMSLAAMAAVSVQNALLGEKLKQAHLDTIFRLAVVVEFRDHSTADHVRRISHLCGVLGRAMNLRRPEVELMEYASPMHDIGKIGIPDSILLKPGALSPEEHKIVETHTLIGAEILNSPGNELLRMAHDIALYHHERWDGAGYPHRLKGSNIPQPARIVCLADVCDALATKRCYKDAYPMDKVIGIIRSEKGRHFDPQAVDAFFSVIEEVGGMYARQADPAAGIMPSA